MALLQGKVCIITGGAGSIGLASARAFLEEGARVMLVDRSETDLRKAAASLADHEDSLDYMTADVADSAQTQNYVSRTIEKWGRLDVLFCHAGISGVIKPLSETPEEVFDAVMAVNVRGTFLACKYALPRMQNGGSIIVTSSIMGVTADPGVSAYAASKHALVGLMRVVAKESASRNIRANILAPGPIDNSFQSQIEEQLSDVVGQNGTEFLNRIIPLGRHGRPEEIARLALFLASDQSSFSTGSIFMADGGMNI